MKTSSKKIPIRKSEMKKRAIYIALCFLALAINVLLFYVCKIKYNEATLDPVIILLVISVIAVGIFRAGQAISRNDPSVMGVFIATMVISLIVVGASAKMSLLAGALMFACLSVQITALLITYFKWVAK